jgi:uncharacterized membrane protein YcaP (DUF421 family)
VWHSMFFYQVPVLEKVLRTILVYATILVLFRIVGKRDLASINMFDFVVLFLLSNVVQNAVIGNDTSLTGGVIGAVTLVAVNALLNRWIAANDRVARVLEGHATIIIKDGKFLPQAARRLSLRRRDIDQAIRVQNGDDISEIATGRIEPNGQLVLSLKHEEQNASKADIAALNHRLEAIEAAIGALSATR